MTLVLGWSNKATGYPRTRARRRDGWSTWVTSTPSAAETAITAQLVPALPMSTVALANARGQCLHPVALANARVQCLRFWVGRNKATGYSRARARRRDGWGTWVTISAELCRNRNNCSVSTSPAHEHRRPCEREGPVSLVLVGRNKATGYPRARARRRDGWGTWVSVSTERYRYCKNCLLSRNPADEHCRPYEREGPVSSSRRPCEREGSVSSSRRPCEREGPVSLVLV